MVLILLFKSSTIFLFFYFIVNLTFRILKNRIIVDLTLKRSIQCMKNNEPPKIVKRTDRKLLKIVFGRPF